METASWRVMAPASFSRMISSWTCIVRPENSISISITCLFQHAGLGALQQPLDTFPRAFPVLAFSTPIACQSNRSRPSLMQSTRFVLHISSHLCLRYKTSLRQPLPSHAIAVFCILCSSHPTQNLGPSESQGPRCPDEDEYQAVCGQRFLTR